MRQAAPLGTLRGAHTLRRDARAADLLLRNFRRRNRRPAPPNPRRRSLRPRKTRGRTMTFAVSVIIPTFNRGAMLLEGIDSVLSQSIQSFELIVIDDGSTDGTAEQLTRLGKTIQFERIEHCGPGAARNRGVAL